MQEIPYVHTSLRTCEYSKSNESDSTGERVALVELLEQKQLEHMQQSVALRVDERRAGRSRQTVGAGLEFAPLELREERESLRQTDRQVELTRRLRTPSGSGPVSGAGAGARATGAARAQPERRVHLPHEIRGVHEEDDLRRIAQEEHVARICLCRDLRGDGGGLSASLRWNARLSVRNCIVRVSSRGRGLCVAGGQFVFDAPNRPNGRDRRELALQAIG